MRRLAGAAAVVVVLAGGSVGGCGSSGSGVTAPQIGAAKTFGLSAFQPAGPIQPGRPTTVSFTVREPNGQPLTQYKTGAGPHTGVHLIIVRDDLAYIIHQHPPVGPTGLLTQSVTFPAPGPYKVLVDIYPNIPGGQPNFQLFQKVTVQGPYHPRALPAAKSSQTVDGYQFAIQGRVAVKAIQAQFVNVEVTDPAGKPVGFVPWFGALAHAIFFRQGSLDYFHTHVCGTGAANCTSTLGGATVSGTSTTPGRLKLGVLLPVPGTWELFIQLKAGGRILTAPFTLHVT